MGGLGKLFGFLVRAVIVLLLVAQAPVLLVAIATAGMTLSGEAAARVVGLMAGYLAVLIAVLWLALGLKGRGWTWALAAVVATLGPIGLAVWSLLA